MCKAVNQMNLCCHLFRQFFKASVFAKLLGNDPYGRISVMHFFNYVMRKVWLHQTRIGLSLYDVAGLGYLKESVRFSLIFDQLQQMSQNFLKCIYTTRGIIVRPPGIKWQSSVTLLFFSIKFPTMKYEIMMHVAKFTGFTHSNLLCNALTM